MEIINRDPKDLKPADYNPRKISDKDFKQLKKSLETFQCVEPIIVNQYEGREGVIVGGHQRLKAMIDLGWGEVPTIEVHLDLEEEKELNVRLNKNTGEFDFDLLGEFFDEDMLTGIGFEFDSELIAEEEAKGKPEMEFSEELFEAHNYVILYFDNELDWQTAVDKFNIKTMKTKDSKDNYTRAGVGRVLRGADYV